MIPSRAGVVHRVRPATTGLVEEARYAIPQVAAYRAARPNLSAAITGITPWAGGLALGYGDWTVNGWQVPLLHLEPGTGAVITLTEPQPTENFSTLRVIGGTLYAPHTDPTSDSKACLTTIAPTGEVSTLGTHQVIHAFDATILSGQIYLCGSTYPGKAAIFTPEQVIAEAPGVGDYQRFYRFYPHTEGTRRVYAPIEGRWFIFDGRTLAPDGEAPPAPTAVLHCPASGAYLVSGARWRLYSPTGALLWVVPVPEERLSISSIYWDGSGLWVGTSDAEVRYYTIGRR